jgi:hypothetical protein
MGAHIVNQYQFTKLMVFNYHSCIGMNRLGVQSLVVDGLEERDCN